MTIDLKIKLIADSYGIDRLLVNNDIEAELVLKMLVEEGLVDLDEYFDEDEEDDESN